jgi:sec-independent protein translocase protein TatB
MVDIGWGELVIIGIVALIAIGPKELPGVLRSLGHWMGKIRRMASEFQGQFQEAMREAEVADLKKTVDDLNTTASSMTNFDPLAEAQKQVDSVFEDKPSDTAEAPTPAPEPSASAPAESAPSAPAQSSSLLPNTDAYVPVPEPAPLAGDADFSAVERGSPKKAGGATPA